MSSDEAGSTRHRNLLLSVGRLAAHLIHGLANHGQVLSLSIAALERAYAAEEGRVPPEVRSKLAPLIAQVTAAAADLVAATREAKDYLRSEQRARAFHLAQEVGRTCSLARPFVEHVASFEVALAEVPEQIGFPAELSHAVLNLLINSVESITRVTGRDHRVALQLVVDGPGVAIVVEDSGEGIAPEHVAHVHDPFFTTRRDETGVGLGLVLVRDTAARHGGKFCVSSVQGSGARITLWLPLHTGFEPGDLHPTDVKSPE